MCPTRITKILDPSCKSVLSDITTIKEQISKHFSPSSEMSCYDHTENNRQKKDVSLYRDDLVSE